MAKKKQEIEAQLPPVEETFDESAERAEAKKRKVLLKLKHIDVKFNVRGRTLNAIRDVNLEIFDGETLAIVGESGSGKSVLTKTFAGMLDSNGFISHGNVYFYDDEISQTDVILNKENTFLRDFLNKKLDEFTAFEAGAEEFVEIEKLTAQEKKDSDLPPEKYEEYEIRQKRISDDLIDASNLIATLNRKDAEEKRQFQQLKEKIAALKKEQKDFFAERKATHKQHLEAFKADLAAREAFKAKIAELNSIRDQKVAAAREKGLDDKTKARNVKIASEILLSTGRYPMKLRIKYSHALLKGYRLAMCRGKDLFTDKQNNRVFEPVVFRVEYRCTTPTETNECRRYIETEFVESVAQEVVEHELLHNDTLIEQARALHPHLRKKLIKKANAAAEAAGLMNETVAANNEKLADLILMKVANYLSAFHVHSFANNCLKFLCDYYASNKKDFECKLKSKPMDVLNGYAHIDCAKVRYTKDWQKIRGRRIATVFQDPMTSLNPILTIGKQIMLVIQKHQNCSAFEAKRRALSIMAKVGIPEPEKRFDDYPFQYSGGMRQRIVIAIALSCQPKILICDEPTTALDVTIQAQIIRLIKKLSKDLGFTTVYITHDLGVVANVAERVAVLYGGQIVELGTVEDIFYDPRHPYTWALLSSLPQLAERGSELFSIAGTPPSLYNKIVGDAFAPRSQYAMAIDFVKEPPMIEINDHHSAKTWLLDPRAPKVEKPEIIRDLHEKMVRVYKGLGE